MLTYQFHKTLTAQDQTRCFSALTFACGVAIAMNFDTLAELTFRQIRQITSLPIDAIENSTIVVVVVVEASEVWSSRANDSLHCIVPIWLSLPVGLQWLHLQKILHVQ